MLFYYSKQLPLLPLLLHDLLLLYYLRYTLPLFIRYIKALQILLLMLNQDDTLNHRIKCLCRRPLPCV